MTLSPSSESASFNEAGTQQLNLQLYLHNYVSMFIYQNFKANLTLIIPSLMKIHHMKPNLLIILL